MGRPGLLGGVLNRVRTALGGRELVGTDALGNKFFRKLETVDGVQVERRSMQQAQGDHVSYDPRAVAPQWRQWLSKTRHEPPTEQEQEQEAARQAHMQLRVAKLHAEEARRRAQAQDAGQEAQAAGGPSLDRFVGQLTGQAPPKAEQPQGGKSPASGGKDGGKHFEPEAWRPGS